MTSFMIIVEIALFIVLIGFTWYRLEAYDGMEKVLVCALGILASWALTSILFSISSKGIVYTDEAMKHDISRILILVFTPINGIALMPYSAKIISDMKFQLIDKTELTKRLILLATIITVVCIIEVKYFTNIQLGIFDIANSLK